MSLSTSSSPSPSAAFPDRLRTAREYLGLNQAELAQKAGMQPSAISHFETGTRKPSFDNLRILADSLDVTTDYLLGRVEEFKALADADRLHRHYESIEGADRKIADELITMLAKRADPYAFATLAAEQIVKGLGIVTLPVDPKAIARGRGIEVVAKPMENEGVSGMLIRYGNEFAIAYATHLENEGFENFSVAHELGHYFLPGHAEAVITGDTGSHASRAGYSSGDKYEAEADRFAAGFLMPRHLFFPALEKAGSGLAAIENLAKLCKTSLHATAIRYTQCTRDPVAVVISRGGIIDHCFMSEALKNLGDIDWLRKREGVPANTATFAFNKVPTNVLHGVRIEEASNLQHWFGGRRSIEISEDVVGLGRYGKTLTVLYDIDVPDAEDEESEQSLIDSWTPRFKR